MIYNYYIAPVKGNHQNWEFPIISMCLYNVIIAILQLTNRYIKYKLVIFNNIF